MGLFRLLLALGVVTEHAGHAYFIGSYTAVQIFFIVSGFYMAMVLSSNRYENLTKFYASRFIRFFPVYWVAAFLSICFAIFLKIYFDISSANIYLMSIMHDLYETRPLIFVWTLVANLLLVTADFSWFMQPIEVGRHPTQLLILPPVWTLALELYFYSMCPWLVHMKTRWLVLIMCIAMGGKFLGYLSGLDTNPFHARLFLFEIFFFIAGIVTYRLYSKSRYVFIRRLLGPIGAVYAAIYLVVVVFFYDIVKLFPGPVLYGQPDYVHSMLMCLLAVPAIIALFEQTRTCRFDFFLGELSFPIYLIHYAFVSTLVHTQVAMPFGLSTFSVVLGLTITMALVLNYLVQIPLDKWRHNTFLYK